MIAHKQTLDKIKILVDNHPSGGGHIQTASLKQMSVIYQHHS